MGYRPRSGGPERSLRFLRFPLILSLSFLLISCSVKYQEGLPPGMQGVEAAGELEPFLHRLEADGERNWVLNLTELAVKAMRSQERDIAKSALDEAIALIEIIYADNPQARKARSLWYEEKTKIFKGDPYERTMVFLYRGILYMQDRDWENARACFRSALYQDSIAEEEQYQADWVVCSYLIGVCEAELGRSYFAEEAFRRARANLEQQRAIYGTLSAVAERPSRSRDQVEAITFGGELPEYSEETNLLVITQQGLAPRKVAAGTYGELLTYRPGGGAGSATLIAIDGGEPQASSMADSLFYQAVTRGGRELDAIQGRQARFKQSTGEAARTGAIVGGFVLTEGAARSSGDMVFVGVIVLAVSAVVGIVSALTRPRADTRSWTSLPESIGIYATSLSPGVHTARLTVPRPRGGDESAGSTTFVVGAPQQGPAVLLTFSRKEIDVLNPPVHEKALQMAEPAALPADLNELHLD